MITYLINGGSKESRTDSIIELFLFDIPICLYVMSII